MLEHSLTRISPFFVGEETLKHLATSVQQFAEAHGERAGLSIGSFGAKRGAGCMAARFLFEVRFRDMGMTRS